MTAHKTDSAAGESDGRDLSDAMYGEHKRVGAHCEDCRAGGYAPRTLTRRAPRRQSSPEARAGPVFPFVRRSPTHDQPTDTPRGSSGRR